MSPEKAKVLFVEDDDMMREAGRMFLEDAGCTVDEASSTDQALEKIREIAAKRTDVSPRESLDAVVTDENLKDRYGRIGGDVVAATTHELLPDVPVIDESAEKDVVGADIRVGKDLLRLVEVVIEAQPRVPPKAA